MDNKDFKKAYTGKYLHIGYTTYQLEPETSKGSCKNCELIGKICTDEITYFCRQGYILKKVKA